jgi:cardiolipin synthase
VADEDLQGHEDRGGDGDHTGRKLLLWLLGILLGTTILLFALSGILHVFRGTPVSGVAQVGTRGDRLSVSDSTFRGTVEALIQTPLEDGNRVQLLLNGDQTYPVLWRDLRAARRSITVRLYYAGPGALADTFQRVLTERARAGVRVYYLYDAVGTSLSDGYLDSLRAGGVKVRAFRPVRWSNLDQAQSRSHVRAVVVDGAVGYTGGFGIDDKWLGDGRHEGQWRDTNVRFTGPAVSRLQAAFAAGWAEADGTLLTGPTFFPPAAFDSLGSRAAGLLYTIPATGSTAAERFFALSIAGASRTFYLTNSYFVPDDDLVRLLEEAARRGVDVRVLTAGEQTDVKAVLFAGRERYEGLLRAGVRIYEYQPSMIHSKTLVVDGRWSTVGTMNFDNRSTALNEESNLVVYDAAFGARMDSVFREDLRYAREIRLESFRHRPWYQKLREHVAAMMAQLL